MTSLTHDSISLRGAGVVDITQQAKGSRFTLDSLLLADFSRVKPKDRILELGAGNGIISILLAKKSPRSRSVAVEVQPRIYALLKRNIEVNGLCDSIVPVHRDIRFLSRSIMPGAFDVIVANPPYTRAGTGKKSPLQERQTARQEHAASIETWLNVQTLLKNKGRYFLVFPANRAAELIFLLRERKLEPKRLRFVHPHQDKPASLALMEAVKSAGVGLDIPPPLIVHRPGGGYTEEMKEIYAISPQSLT